MVKSYFWIGGTGNYSDPNWNDGVAGDNGPPTIADDATINTGDTVTADSSDAALNLTVDNGTLFVATNLGVLTVAATLTVGETSTGLNPNSVNSILTVETGGMVNTGTLVVGDEAGSDGQVGLYAPGASGDTLLANTIDVGVDGTGYLYLYTGASAQIDYSGGSANTTGTSEIGENADADGVVYVNDSTFDIGGTLNVGDGGAGSLAFADGASGQLLNVGIGVQPTSVLGLFFIDASSVSINGTLTLGGSGSLQVMAGGSLNVSGTTTNNGLIIDDADVVAAQPDVVIGDISGTGQIELADASSLELTGSAGSGQTISFENVPPGSTGQTLQIDSTSISTGDDFQSTIANMRIGDTINLANLADATGYSFDGTTLIVNFVGGATASLNLSGVNALTQFNLSPFGSTGTTITIIPNIYTWTGGDGTTDFSDPLNWSPTSGPPGIDDTAQISDDATTTNPVTITAPTEVYNLVIDDGALNDVGYALTVDNDLTVGVDSTTGAIPNSLLSLGGGAVLTAGYLDIGQGTGNGGSVTVDNSTLQVTNSIVVGDATTGQLFVNEGGVVTAATIAVGNQADGNGLLSIDGGNVASTGPVAVGVDGFGFMDLSSGGVVNVGSAAPGSGADFGVGTETGNGSVLITDPGTALNVSRQLYVGGPSAPDGNNSIGGNQFTVMNGAVVTVDTSGDAETLNIDALAIAFESAASQVDGTDEVYVSGEGSQLNVEGTIVVGVDGLALLEAIDGATISGEEYPTGISGAGQDPGSMGEIFVSGEGSSYTDNDFNLGGGGEGELTIQDGGNVTLDDLFAATSSTGSGYITVTGAGSSLNATSISLAGFYDTPTGGSANLTVENGATVTIGGVSPSLNVLGNSSGYSFVNLDNIGSGTVSVGDYPDGESASDTQFQGALVVNPDGILNLNNGLIEGGILYLNGGTFEVTPVSDQIDDLQSLLQDVTIEGQDLSITDAVLTLAGDTYGATGDNVLINATSSLVDLSGLGGFGDSESFLDQTINATDLALTVANPTLQIGPFGQIIGTGAVFSDYEGFSGDVDLVNHGFVDAVYNDAAEDNSAELSIVTDTITNAPDGTFEADPGATLNIGSDADVFTNLQNNGGAGSSLVDGLYNADGGTIDISGNYNPIFTLEAVLYLTGADGVNGNLLVNGASIEQTLTTVTPSETSGEGDLVINSASVTFANPIDIQGLQSDDPAGWSVNTGYSGAGGGLYLDDGTFNGPDLTISAAPSGGEAAFIYGNGIIDAPVTLDGTAEVHDYGDSESTNILEFEDAVTGSGNYTIEGGDVLWFNSTLGVPSDPVTANTINFAAGPSSLIIGASDVTEDFRATIKNFAAGDEIILSNVQATSAQFNSSTDQLDVYNGDDNVAILQLDNSIATGQRFDVTYGANGSTIEFAPPCYCRGTLIRTDRGEVPVEDLAIGDEVMTTAGTTRSIKWIGRRKVAARFADPLATWPVRIKAGALGDNLPSRDLLLSPDHAVLVDGILIQAGALVNGCSIVRESDVPETFTYYHVELDDHSLILAENTPAETFVDNIDRMGFDNWAEHEALYPNATTISEMPYARAKAYRQVPRLIRDRLAARAATISGDARYQAA